MGGIVLVLVVLARSGVLVCLATSLWQLGEVITVLQAMLACLSPKVCVLLV